MRMVTVTIPKKQYRDLVDAKLRYEYLRSIIENDLFAPPPTQKVEEIVRAFRDTKQYRKEFLKSLGRGLRRSSHFRL